MNSKNVGYKFDTSFTMKGLLSNTPKMWLKSKRKADDLNGLWRIHDNIYDFTNFIQWHPGGQFWLEATKGTDITEAFEIHHVKNDRPERLLNHFFIKSAPKQRLSRFTFANDGFYKTLKRNVKESLTDVSENDTRAFDAQTDMLLIGTILLAIFSVMNYSFKYAFAAGFCAALTLIANHSYVHKRNNLRMYYSDLLFISSSDFRVIHILNHHVFTNSAIDVHRFISLFLKKTFSEKKSVSWVIGLPFWPFAIHAFTLLKIAVVCVTNRFRLNADIFLPIILPVLMISLGNQSFQVSLMFFNFIIVIESFFFCLMLFVNNCYYYDAQSDTSMCEDVKNAGCKKRCLCFKCKKSNDWGMQQLNTTCVRRQGETYVVIGDRALHYLFPTLERDVFHRLYPVVVDTLNQFNAEIQLTPQTGILFECLKQLLPKARLFGDRNLKSD